MAFKTAILDRDGVYTERLGEWMRNNKKECVICGYSDLESALDNLSSDGVSLLMAAECMQVMPGDVSADVAFGYMTGEPVDSLNDRPAVCKYQKGSEIFEQLERIISSYKEERARRIADRARNFKIFAVASASGGAGAQVAAEAFYKNLNNKGKDVLLVNLKAYGSVDSCLTGKPPADAARLFDLGNENEMTGILKENKCFDYSAYPQRRSGLTGDNVTAFIGALRKSLLFDAAIFVMDLDFQEENMAVFEASETIIAVVEESKYSTDKFNRKIRALKNMEKTGERILNANIAVIYNKFSNAKEYRIEDDTYRVLGGFPLLSGVERPQMTDRFAGMAVFNPLQ